MRKALEDALSSEDLLPKERAIIDKTTDALLKAIEQYHSALPPAISNVRKELRNLTSSLKTLHAQYLSMSPQAIQIYCEALGSPKGQFTPSIEGMLTNTEKALEIANSMKNITPKTALNILVYQVAEIMRDVMEISPKLTRDSDKGITVSQAGAAYARLLRKVAIVADIKLPKDIYRRMKRALVLLDDPYGNNSPT